ncbi:phage holin family protein [Pendulispora brunnea]|uniref:Phage holin family protein n=1 Tax=Pendulispora brunnea TaxID=2905690 RepID=A0ABZ2K244_9BACT
MGQNQLLVSLGHLMISGLSVFIVAQIMPGMRARGFGSAIIFALVVALLNAVAWHFLRPVTITLSVLTLGLGGVILNGILFLIAGSLSGVKFAGCITASIASLFVTVVNWGLEYILAAWLRK